MSDDEVSGGYRYQPGGGYLADRMLVSSLHIDMRDLGSDDEPFRVTDGQAQRLVVGRDGSVDVNGGALHVAADGTVTSHGSGLGGGGASYPDVTADGLTPGGLGVAGRLGLAGAVAAGDTTLAIGDLTGNDVLALTSAARNTGNRALTLRCQLQMPEGDYLSTDAMTGFTLPWTLDQFGLFLKAVTPSPCADFRPMDGSPDSQVVLQTRDTLGAPQFQVNTAGGAGFYGATPPTSAPTITGSRAAMGTGVYPLIQALAAMGAVIDGTTT